MAGPKLKMPECLQSLRDLGKSNGIISKDEYNQPVHMEVEYEDQAFQTAVRRVFFLVWAKPYVANVTKGGSAEDFQMDVSAQVSGANLQNTKTEYVDAKVTDRSPTAIGMLVNIGKKSYVYPRRALMYVIEKCSEAAYKGVCEYLGKLEKDNGANAGKVGEIRGNLSLMKEEVVKLTKDLQKSSDQDSERVQALGKKQNAAAKHKATRKALHEQDKNNKLGLLTRTKNRMARYFSKEGKLEGEELQCQQSPATVTTSNEAPPPPPVSKVPGTKLKTRVIYDKGWTWLNLVQGKKLPKKETRTKQFGEINWNRAKTILNELNKNVQYLNKNNKWTTPLPTNEPESLQSEEGIRLIIYGYHQDKMVETRTELNKVGYTIRGKDGK